MNSPCETSDLLVFSHLNWDSVLQRPQHLLSRHAKHRRVYYIEEAVIGITKEARLHIKIAHEDVKILVPYLPKGLSESATYEALKKLLDELIQDEGISDFTSLYYTPKALNYSRHLNPITVLYDCMDSQATENEDELMQKANLVFTNSQFLYEAKKQNHHNTHLLPSSVDYDHFSQSRMTLVEPEDQMNIPHPRIGFYGVIDERFDLNLLKKMAELRPEFQFIMVGPIAKVDLTSLPMKANIHYLGKKDYHTLPLYLSGWDCTFIPYALNDSTRFSNPTKTPEFLASGKPVVSTSIPDVIHPYADAKIVYIADHPEHFVECIEKAINESTYDPEWLERVDHFLEGKSWDATFIQMANLENKINKVEKNISIPAYMDHALIQIGIA
jgi:UDP-galactopyranose mutase